MYLFDAPCDTELKVEEIISNEECKRKLNTLGVHMDDIIIKLTEPRFGPFLITLPNLSINKIAIGRGLAKKIKVCL